jgi:nucleoside-diphosphate-sugar epimerase
MRILVTGAAGGIGSTLCLQLKNSGHYVVGLDNLNNGYQENLVDRGDPVCHIFLQEDIRNTQSLIETLSLHNIDIIIHLAAITALPVCESDPIEAISVNVGGTASIMAAARERSCKVIFASTSAIYENNTKEQTPFREDLPTNPMLVYPLTKKMAEDVVHSYINNYGMDAVILRFFNVFGPRQDIHRKMPPLINYIVRSIKNGEELKFYSDGYQERDYVHVDDVTQIIEKCLNNGAGETFNVCTGTLTSVRDIVGVADTVFDGPLQYTFNPPDKYWDGYSNLHTGLHPLNPNAIVREVNKFALGSCEKAEQVLGWIPRKDILTLVAETLKENYEILDDRK